MSYESRTFKFLSLPNPDEVIKILLTSLLKHDGRVKEFGSGDQEFADEMANSLGLSHLQRSFLMETLVRKEGRRKTFPAWNRLLFRAADLAAKQRLLARPKDTLKLTGKREWMLTEKGIEEALRFSGIPVTLKEEIPIPTYEVQKIKRELEIAEPLKNYNPVDSSKKRRTVTRESLLRARGFRQAVVQAYYCTCAVCGLKLSSPDSFLWEVEAAHIVPHRFFGKDDIWNGIALCHFHHWAFDVGWFTLRADFTIEFNEHLRRLPPDQGLMIGFDIVREMTQKNRLIRLPVRKSAFPHENSILWHRNNIFTNSL